MRISGVAAHVTNYAKLAIWGLEALQVDEGRDWFGEIYAVDEAFLLVSEAIIGMGLVLTCLTPRFRDKVRASLKSRPNPIS